MTTDQQQAVVTWLTERGIPAPPVEDAEVPRPGPKSGDAEGSTPTAEDPEADPYAVARTIALRKLTVQARTRHELEQALRAKQVPEQVARDVLDRLTSVGLINDAVFARDWVASRQRRRHLSRSALKRELGVKGVAREDIDAALETVDADAEFASALDLAQRKQGQLAGLAPEVRYRRLAGAAQPPGFRSGDDEPRSGRSARRGLIGSRHCRLTVG